jgi:uncharacterized membrane protein YqiK
MGALVLPAAPTPKPELDANLATIKKTIESIEVSDRDSYARLLEARLLVKAYKKSVGHELDPGIDKAKELLDLLKNQKAKFIDPADVIYDGATARAKAWLDEDERLRRAEQDRINEAAEREKNRKAEEDRIVRENEAKEQKAATIAEIRGKLQRKDITKRQAEKLLRMAGAEHEANLTAAAAAAEEAKARPAEKVQVKSDVPAVAGTRRSRVYKFMVIDPAKVTREWCEPDLVRIGEEVRRLKDDDAAMAKIQGIKAWNEPSI